MVPFKYGPEPMLISVANHTACKCQEPQMIRRQALPHRKSGSVSASLSQINTVPYVSGIIFCLVSLRLIFILNVHQEMLEIFTQVRGLTMGPTIISDTLLNLTAPHDKVIVNGDSDFIKTVCFWKRSSKRLLDQLRL